MDQAHFQKELPPHTIQPGYERDMPMMEVQVKLDAADVHGRRRRRDARGFCYRGGGGGGAEEKGEKGGERDRERHKDEPLARE